MPLARTLAPLGRPAPSPGVGAAPRPGTLNALVLAPPFELEVLSGIQQGVKIEIAGPTCLIGASTECDVVLAGTGVADRHCRISLYAWKAAVEALDGDVGREGQSTVVAGYGCRAELPMDLLLGETRIRISRKAGSSRRLKPLLIGAGAFALLTIVTMFASRATEPDYDAARQRSAASRFPDRAPYAASPEAMRQLRARIEEAGLSSLSVTAADGRIEVAGELVPAEMAKWTEIEQWFDRTHGRDHLLSSMVEPGDGTAAPQIRLQAIWLGPQPYVIDRRGERIYPGGALEDGWVLKSIDTERVTVSRNGQDMAIVL